MKKVKMKEVIKGVNDLIIDYIDDWDDIEFDMICKARLDLENLYNRLRKKGDKNENKKYLHL
jgi:hypothetical protein